MMLFEIWSLGHSPFDGLTVDEVSIEGQGGERVKREGQSWEGCESGRKENGGGD